MLVLLLCLLLLRRVRYSQVELYSTLDLEDKATKQRVLGDVAEFQARVVAMGVANGGDELALFCTARLGQ